MSDTSNKYILNHLHVVNGVFTDLDWTYAKVASASAYKAEFGNFINKGSSLGIAVPVVGLKDWVMVGVSNISASDSSKTASYALSLLTALSASKISRSSGLSLVLTELGDGIIHALCLRGNVILLDMVVNPQNSDDSFGLITFISDSTLPTEEGETELQIINLVSSEKTDLDALLEQIEEAANDNKSKCTTNKYEINYDEFFSVITKKNVVYIKDIKQYSALKSLDKKKVLIGLIALALATYYFTSGDEKSKIDPFAEAIRLQKLAVKNLPVVKNTSTLIEDKQEERKRFNVKKKAIVKAEIDEINALINADLILNWPLITKHIKRTQMDVIGWRANFVNVFPNTNTNYTYMSSFTRDSESTTVLHLKSKFPEAETTLTGNSATRKYEIPTRKDEIGFDILSSPSINFDYLTSKLQMAKSRNEIASWNLAVAEGFFKKTQHSKEIITLFNSFEDKTIEAFDWVIPVKRYKLTVQGNSTKTIEVLTKILASIYNNKLEMVTYDISTNRLTMEIYLYVLE